MISISKSILSVSIRWIRQVTHASGLVGITEDIMTTEIAVLNKSAVALAADSAVTISNAGSVKV